MPNPRFINQQGEPTAELIGKLRRAVQVYYGNIGWFSEKWNVPLEELKGIQNVFLIGSHAGEEGWKDETSDIDFGFVIPTLLPEVAHRYKREVLDRMLHEGEKRRWIDLFFVRENYQITNPRWELTPYWENIQREISP